MITQIFDMKGTHYFIAKKGLVALATVPIQEGDLLCLIPAAPIYFILQEREKNI